MGKTSISLRTQLILSGVRVLREARLYRISVTLACVALWKLARSRQRQRSLRRVDPNHIVVVRLDALGDLIMTSLIFRELKLRFPNAVVTAVIQGRNKEILETNPYVDRIVCPPPTASHPILRGLRRDVSIVTMYLKELRHTPPDVVVNPRLDGDLYSADVLLSLLDAPATFRYQEPLKKGFAATLDRFAFRNARTLPRPSPRHEVLNNIAITQAITQTPCDTRPEIFLTAADLAYGSDLRSAYPPDVALICIAFGAHAMRRVWPIELWAEVIDLISRERPVVCLIACTPSERDSGTRLQKLIRNPSRLLIGGTLRQLAAVLNVCDLFLGPDSGPAHLAAAVSCPSVVVSPHPENGDADHSNSPTRFSPFSTSACVVQPKEGLRPCTTACEAVVPHCILQVSPDQVAETCLKVLHHASSADRAQRNMVW